MVKFPRCLNIFVKKLKYVIPILKTTDRVQLL